MMSEVGKIRLMVTTKLTFISVGLLLLAGSVIAEDYVPPPTGPYQSSVIINKDSVNSGSSGQVYRFPSDIMVQTEHKKPPLITEASRYEPEQMLSSKKLIVPEETIPVKKYSLPVVTPPVKPLAGNISGNPWAVDNAIFPNSNVGNGGYPQYQYQGNWNNPQYSYPQQYPYGYNNQNNFMNNPFSGMPSPWYTMPMQPFFSGK